MGSNTARRLTRFTGGRWPLSWRVIAYAIACALPLLTTLAITLLAIRVPFMDEWAWADLIYRFHLGSLTFHDLWLQHNEHRLFFPNLIALGLASLGGWSQLRETLFSVLLVVITQIGIFVLLRRIIVVARLPFVFLAASLMLYSFAQIENWDWGFQLAWFLCNACAVWAVLLLGTAGQSWFAWVAAGALAIVASFSSSQGLMVWFGGLATLVLTEKRRPVQIGLWILLAVAIFMLYFYGYEHPPTLPDPLLGLHRPAMTLRYFGAYLGTVFAGWIGYPAAVACGWAALVALAVLVGTVIATFRRDRRIAARANSFIGLAAYALCVAAITTAGRVGLGETSAEASRYTSIAIYCWITIFALASAFEVPVLARFRYGSSVLLPIVVTGLIVLYAGANRNGLALGKSLVAQTRSSYPALIVGSGPELTGLFPFEQPVEVWIKELQAVKDGPYYK